MSFDVEGARKAGYSDAEIADYVGKDAKFDVNGAREAGYSDNEILDHLTQAATEPKASWGERLLHAPKAAFEGLGRGMAEEKAATGQGWALQAGYGITPAELAAQSREQAAYEASQSPEERAFTKKVQGLREEAKVKGEAAKVWTPPAGASGIEGLASSFLESKLNKGEPTAYDKYQAGIKARLGELGLEDTPANRKKAMEADQSTALAANRKVAGEIVKQVGTNPEAFARAIGEMAPGVVTTMLPSMAAGYISKRPSLAAVTMFVMSQPKDVRNRFVAEASKELAARKLEPTLENYTKLYADDNWRKTAESKAIVGGTVSSGVASALLPVGGVIAGTAERSAVQRGISAAEDRALKRTAAQHAATTGRIGQAEQVAEELRAAGMRPQPTPYELRSSVEEARKAQSRLSRAGASAAGSATILASPVLGEAAARAATGEEGEAGDLAKAAVSQLPFALLEAYGMRKALRPIEANKTYVPTDKQYTRDINEQWGKANEAETPQAKEAHVDTAVGMEADRYHSTGEKAADRAEFRDSYRGNMEKAEAVYRELLDNELAKPADKQDKKRVDDLNKKIQFTRMQREYVSEHPLAPELTVEEVNEFHTRMDRADQIEDPAEANAAKQQIQDDYNNLVKERRDEREKTAAGAGREMGEAGEPAGRGTGEGAGEPAQQGEAGTPGPEGLGATGLGGAGHDAAGLNAGEAAPRGPLTPEEIVFANRALYDRRVSPEAIFGLADRMGVEYDRAEEVGDVLGRVRDRLEQLQDAVESNADLPIEDILARRAEGRPLTAIDHAVAENIGKGYTHEWGVDINVARDAEELRNLSGRNIGDNVKGFYDPETGKVWINSALHGSEADVKSTIFHETLGHYGLSKKFGTELDGLLRDLYKKNEGIQKAVEDWRNEKLSDTETNADTYSHLDPETQTARAVEEVLARRSEEGQVKSSEFRQLIALIRKYLRKIPKIGERMKYSDNDILHILRDAHEAVTKGKDEFVVGPDGQVRYSTIGAQAKLTKNEEANLRLAERLDASGEHPQVIRDATGWVKNPADGEWRRVLSDSNATLKRPLSDIDLNYYDKYGESHHNFYKLGDILKHKDLLDRYPELADVEVARSNDPNVIGNDYGLFDSTNNRIIINGRLGVREFLRKLHHEMQHWIQKKEGFAQGGAPEYLGELLNDTDVVTVGDSLADVLDSNKIARAEMSAIGLSDYTHPDFIRNLRQGDRESINKLLDPRHYNTLPQAVQNVAHEAYENLTGEYEARQTEQNMGKTQTELDKTPYPYEHYKNTYPVSAAQKVSQPSREPIPTTPEASLRYAKGRLNDLKDAATQMPKFNVGTYNALRNRVSSAYKGAADSLLHFLDTAKVAELYGHKLSAVRTVHEITGRQSAETHSILLDLTKKSRDWMVTLRDLGKKNKQFNLHEFNDVALQTTINQIDPLAPASKQIYDDVRTGKNPHPTERDREVHNLMDRYLKLPPEAQNVYKELRDYYDSVRERYIKMVEQYGGKNAADKLRQAYQDSQLQVYLPLTRSGDFWVSYLDKLGDTHEVSFESPHEREKFMKWADKQGYSEIAAYMREEQKGQKGTPPAGLLGDVVEILKAKGASQDLLEATYETFLDYSHSGSVAQMFRTRKGTEGYSQNVVGSFSQVAPRLEKQISKLKYADQYAKAMDKFHEELQQDVIPKEFAGLEKRYTKSKLPDEYSNLQSYLNNHINTMLNPRHDGWTRFANNITAFDYYMTIAGNASTGVVNMMSLPLVSMPLLEMEHGIGKTFSAYERALGMVRNGGFDKTEHDLIPDWTFGVNAKGEYKVLHNALMDSGVISRSLGADMYEMRNVSPSDFNRITEGAKRTLGFVMQNTERFNREASAIAAFILKREQGASVSEAVNYAIEHVEFVHGPGSIETTAPRLKHPAGRVLYTLRRFAVTTLWQQGRLLKAATLGVPEKTRGLAAKQFIAMWTHAGLLVGAKGVPLMGMGLLAASFMHWIGLVGDKDKPFLPDEELRNSTGMFYGGLMDYLTGADISSRNSLSDLAWRSDPAALRKSGGLDYFLHNVGGVNYSLAANWANAFDLLSKGETERAFEAISPAAARNLEQTGRLMVEGAGAISGKKMKTAEGTNIALTSADILKKFFGFNPKEIAEYQARHRNVMEDTAQYKDLINETRSDYMKAMEKMYSTEDPTKQQEYYKRAVEAAQRWGRIHQKNKIPFQSSEAKDFINSFSNSKLSEMYDVDGVKSSIMQHAFMTEHSERNK